MKFFFIVSSPFRTFTTNNNITLKVYYGENDEIESQTGILIFHVFMLTSIRYNWTDFDFLPEQ